jgi:hypothetical protein
MTGNLISAHTASWNQQAVSNDHASWTGVPGEPQTDMSVSTNSDLLYSNVAEQHVLGKTAGLNGLPLWQMGGMNSVTSSPSADLLLSPISPCTDPREMYSPGPGYTPVTPDCSSMSYGMSAGVATASSSPDFLPLTPQSIMGQQHGAGGFHDDSKVSTTRVAPFFAADATTNARKQADTATWLRSDSPYGRSQTVSPGTPSWYPPGYALPQFSAAQDFHDHQTVFDARPNSTMLPFDRRSMQRVQWSNKSNVPTQSHFQSRFMMPLNDGEKEQRKKDDDLLLKMKQDGRTYRDIRKALGRKVAESTLRGRYRSLTKPRRERVRAPKWTGADVSRPNLYRIRLADEETGCPAQEIRTGRARQARRDTTTPRQQAEARQSRLDEDCRLDRNDRRNIQVRSSNGEEEVA